eukprot:gene4935-502_t
MRGSSEPVGGSPPPDHHRDGGGGGEPAGGTPPPGFNFVKIKYCSGDSHMGRQLMYAPWNMSFCGHLIVAEIISSLKQTHGPGAAGGRVVVSGSSAGGHGTYINADYR